MSPEHSLGDQPEDNEVTRPNQRVLDERARRTEELRGIADQANATESTPEQPVDPEAARAERMARKQDEFFAKGVTNTYEANGLTIVTNGDGRYLSYASPEAAQAAQSASEARLQAARHQAEQQSAQAPVEQADAPDSEIVTPTESEQSPQAEAERLRREKTEDLVLGSAARQIGRTITGDITVRANGEILTYKNPEDYDLARQKYIQRKQAQIEAAQSQIDASRLPAQKVRERPPLAEVEVAHARSSEDDQAEKLKPEEEPEATTEPAAAPEQNVEVPVSQAEQLSADAEVRGQRMRNVLGRLNTIFTNEFGEVVRAAQSIQGGFEAPLNQARGQIFEAITSANQSVAEAKRKADEAGTPDAMNAYLESTKQAAARLEATYSMVTDNLNRVYYQMPTGSLLQRVAAESVREFTQRNSNVKRELDQLAQ